MAGNRNANLPIVEGNNKKIQQQSLEALVNNDVGFFEEDEQTDDILEKRKKNELEENSSEDTQIIGSGKRRATERREEIDRSRVNHTVTSEGNGKVVLMKPTGSSSRNLFSRPVAFSKAFTEVIGMEEKIADIRVNKVKEVIAIELKESNKDQIDKLLKITAIKEWNVQFYLPYKEKLKHGVIQQIDKDVDLEELKYSINESQSQYKVVILERLRRRMGTEFLASNSVKISIDGGKLPECIKVGFFIYKVRPFVFQPVQCFKCQRYWHTAESCKATKQQCLLCAENHAVKECKVKDIHNFRCANCGAQHKANSSECPVREKASRVEKLRAEGMTFQSAYNLVYQNDRQSQSQMLNPENVQRNLMMNGQFVMQPQPQIVSRQILQRKDARPTTLTVNTEVPRPMNSQTPIEQRNLYSRVLKGDPRHAINENNEQILNPLSAKYDRQTCIIWNQKELVKDIIAEVKGLIKKTV